MDANEALGNLKMISGKQKAKAVATLVILVLVIWQVIGLFSGDSSRKATTVAVTAPQAGASSMMTEAQMPVIKQAKIEPEPEIYKIAKETQLKYMQALNELEMLKVQRDIAETSKAIAESKLSEAKSEKDIKALADASKPLPYATRLGSTSPEELLEAGAIPGLNTSSQKNPPPTTTVAAAAAEYALLSVSMQGNQWTAVIGYKDKLYNVTVGDMLSSGYEVKAISERGVTLTQGKDEKRLSIAPII